MIINSKTGSTNNIFTRSMSFKLSLNIFSILSAQFSNCIPFAVPNSGLGMTSVSSYLKKGYSGKHNNNYVDLVLPSKDYHSFAHFNHILASLDVGIDVIENRCLVQIPGISA